MLALLLTSLLTIVQLNCENLFDCRHDTLKNDVEFTPEGDYQWTKSRYFRHLDNTARTIMACAETDSTLRLPDIVTLCEVENDTVMTDLTRRSLLRSAGYGYVMTSSGDPRGIDVALLYSPFTVEMLSWHAVSVPPEAGQRATRDLLYAKIRFLYADTVHIVALHAPSRRDDSAAQQRYRERIMDCVAQIADSVEACDGDALLIVAGDFNDYGGSTTLRRLTDRHLVHVSEAARGRNGAGGTYFYRHFWGSIDHIFASAAMARRLRDCQIGDFMFLLEPDSRPGQLKPRRSFLGTKYHYGYSDHLPLIARFAMPAGF